MIQIEALDVRIPAEIIHNWGWFLAFGIGLVLLGIVAIARAVAAIFGVAAGDRGWH